MPRLSKIGAAALAAFGWTGGASVSASYLVVAGGGGGAIFGGGGGAGGLLASTVSLNPTLSYTVTVGAGGAGTGTQGVTGVSGSNSVFGSFTSTGGGGGGAQGTGTTGSVGLAGGSGGGGGSPDSGGVVTGAGGAGTSGQGNAGGSGITDNSSYRTGGGGGGASAAGANGVSANGGNGGNGTASSISGSSVTYAGGGGGGTNSSGRPAGTGGTGGGGAGGAGGSAVGTNGTANLGGGGGGASSAVGGSGGSGIVIISYVGAQQFGGGVVTTDGTNTIHTFTTSGTLSPATPLTASALVVAGGGGGGAAGGGGGGGGGAGGFRTATGLTIDTNSTYLVTVGAGGAGGTTGQSGSTGNGTSGSDSIFLATTSTGGGGGGAGGGTQDGKTGGSGGGGGHEGRSGGAGNTPSTSPSQGNNGGNGVVGRNGGGGGGGASAVGAVPPSTAVGGAGGAGTANSISGSSVTYAGGGGGAANTTGGAGGAGGGGAGGIGGGASSVAGTANTGGGAGGAYGNTGIATAGGSGVVIISYPGATQSMAGGTVTISGGNVIHTFTSSGYLTPIKLASRSLRFRSSATAYLNQTLTNTPTSTQKCTISFWVKRGVLGSAQNIMGSYDGSSGGAASVGFLSNDTFSFAPGGTASSGMDTTRVFRDPSAWYHIVVACDSTLATAANRILIYVNGVTAVGSTPAVTQNGFIDLFRNGFAQYIGRTYTGSQYFDGYLAEFNGIDGQALTPSSFGTVNSFGVWQPITYGGSYGTNGFYLTFGNNTSTTTLGYDTSPQGNNWTTNNISVTAGATYDSMLDVPTLTSATVANYAVMNPLVQRWSQPNTAYADGNLKVSTTSANSAYSLGTISQSTGKYYWEVTVVAIGATAIGIGVGDSLVQNTTLTNTVQYLSSGSKTVGGSSTAYGASFTTNDVIGVALDLTGSSVTFYKNNTSQGSIGLPSITNITAFQDINNPANLAVNFGQRPFTYTAPSGFVALNTFNLSTPTIPNGAVYFAATTYTGTGASLTVANTVNGTAMQPDWVWVKGRSGATDHAWYDAVRGVQNQLESNTTTAETTETTGLTAFGTTGFTIGALAQMNTNAATYVGWQWNAGGSTVTNTSGTISAQVRANTTAGFSVVTASASGTSPVTIGHGLGVAPKMIIGRVRNNTANWYVYNGNFSASDYLVLNTTAARATSSNIWDTAPTSTVFTVGNPQNGWNGGTPGSYNYVFYCFAEIAGYSAFGSYTGNGSTDGPFVFLGFRPRFIVYKISSGTTGNWKMHDTSRGTYNADSPELLAESSAAESASSGIFDLLSNGFKLRTTSSNYNGSGNTYIYMAFAENPFKYANAR